MVQVGVTGDVMLGRTVDETQRRRDAAAVWGDVLEALRALDGLVINLECCLSTRGSPWQRTHRPFHFRADPGWAIPALEAAGVDACALANNHLLDFGKVALSDTIEHLDAAGIAHAGAGPDREAAFAPATFAVGDRTIAMVSWTDNTPEYAASADDPGVAHVRFDLDDDRQRRRMADSLELARASDPDLLIASLHWGPNMVETPPADFQRVGRWLVDRGVDVVHGHSAHVFQAVEVHAGRPIMYDTGDFVDDYAVDDDLRNDRSFLFDLAVAEGGEPTGLTLEPVEIRERAVHHAPDHVARWSRERMRELSADYGTDFERDGDGLRLSLAD